MYLEALLCVLFIWAVSGKNMQLALFEKFICTASVICAWLMQTLTTAIQKHVCYSIIFNQVNQLQPDFKFFVRWASQHCCFMSFPERSISIENVRGVVISGAPTMNFPLGPRVVSFTGTDSPVESEFSIAPCAEFLAPKNGKEK